MIDNQGQTSEVERLRGVLLKWFLRAVHFIHGIAALLIVAIMFLVYWKYIYNEPSAEELAAVIEPQESLMHLTLFLIILAISWFTMMKGAKLLIDAQAWLLRILSSRSGGLR